MRTPDDKSTLEADRRALTEYYAGDQAHPFVLDLRENYCICDVFVRSPLDYMKVGFRALLMGAVRLIPLSSIKVFFYRLCGVRIGRDVYIAPGVFIDPLFPWLIELEDGCLLGMGCRLFTHEYTATNFRIGRVRVGKGSVVGAYATVRSGVTIGSKVTVGFNSYVNKDVPDGATVGGVPAKILRRIGC